LLRRIDLDVDLRVADGQLKVPGLARPQQRVVVRDADLRSRERRQRLERERQRVPAHQGPGDVENRQVGVVHGDPGKEGLTAGIERADTVPREREASLVPLSAGIAASLHPFMDEQTLEDIAEGLVAPDDRPVVGDETDPLRGALILIGNRPRLNQRAREIEQAVLRRAQNHIAHDASIDDGQLRRIVPGAAGNDGLEIVRPDDDDVRSDMRLSRGIDALRRRDP
jgi:hypothetical protein